MVFVMYDNMEVKECTVEGIVFRFKMFYVLKFYQILNTKIF
jgi:hypothetical protein